MKPEALEALVFQERVILGATERICEALEEQGITREELARRIDRTPAFVSQILSGERNMTLRTLARVADALGYDVAIEMAPR